MKISELFEAYYGRRDASTVIVDEDCPYLHSYVPYLRGQTHILAYNFLRSNYNLRDPVLLRIWVSPNNGICTPKNITTQVFAPDSVFHLDPENVDALTDFDDPLGSLHIKIYHPKVKTANGEFRFMAFYHQPGFGCAGIHSLGARGLKMLGTSFGSRAILATGLLHHAIDAYELKLVESSNLNMDLSKLKPQQHTLLGPSFFVSTDESNNVAGVWHDSDMTQRLQRSVSKSQSCPIRQAFPIPNFPTGSPVIWLDKDNIGFTPESIKFVIFDVEGHEITQLKVTTSDLPLVLNLSQLFRNAPHVDTAFAIADFGADHSEFNMPALAYLQMWYPGKASAGDQIHSMITPSYWTDPQAEPVSYRCRKFAPWTLTDGVDWSYSIVNVGGHGGNRDNTLKFRVTTDCGEEEVFWINLPDERVSTIKAEEIFKRPRLTKAKSAIVQIEAEKSNFNAYWVARDTKSGSIGIDHFTGG